MVFPLYGDGPHLREGGSTAVQCRHTHKAHVCFELLEDPSLATRSIYNNWGLGNTAMTSSIYSLLFLEIKHTHLHTLTHLSNVA